MAALVPVALNLDDSLPDQPLLWSRMQRVLDLRDQDIRLSCPPAAADAVAKRIADFCASSAAPLLTFIGSGDYHHVSLLLLRALQAREEPFTLVLIDNHPDWCCQRPANHCGNWVSSALQLPRVRRAMLLGQDSADLVWHRLYHAPLSAIADGTLSIRPLRAARRRLPLRWPLANSGSAVHRAWWGSDLRFEPEHRADHVLAEIAQSLQGQAVYVSIDKDCLRPADAQTDWEQGGFELESLAKGLQELALRCRLVGADVCGDRAPAHLNGLWKRLDAGRWRRRRHDRFAAARINERANLALLASLTGEPSVHAPRESEAHP
jgi:hypothetical protein